MFARNAEIIGHDSLALFGGSAEEQVGAHAVATFGNLAAVAVNGPGHQGFHLFDTTDGALSHLSFYDAKVSVRGDRTIAFSADGATVFLGHESGPQPGVAAVDVTDPANPVLAGFWSDQTGFGPHTIGAGEASGTQYVFLLNAGVTILSYADGTFTLEGKYVTSDDLGILGALQSSSGATTYALRTVYGHDMAFWYDNATNTPYLAVAYAYDGVKLLDISNPAAPVLVMRWTPPTDTGHNHYVHSAAMYRDAQDRVILVVGSETFEEENQGIASPLWMLDVTAALGPTSLSPIHLNTWTNPGDAPAGHLSRSVHFFRVLEGVLYVSHYHGGVWALDVAAPTSAPPATLGYIMPVATPAITPPEDCCIGFDLEAVPMIFDVDVTPGGVVAADLIQGVFLLDMKTS